MPLAYELSDFARLGHVACRHGDPVARPGQQRGWDVHGRMLETGVFGAQLSHRRLMSPWAGCGTLRSLSRQREPVVAEVIGGERVEAVPIPVLTSVAGPVDLPVA